MKKIFGCFVLAALILSGLAIFNSDRLRAEDAQLTAKLEEIANGQEKILAEIQAIRQELDIIKIRITQNQ
jgi:hypothetical protein